MKIPSSIRRIVRVAALAVILGALVVAALGAPGQPEKLLLLAGLDTSVVPRSELEQAPREAVLLLDEFGLEAYLAGKRYPEAALRLYATFGQTPEFQNALSVFGPAQVIPVVWYCWNHGTLSTNARSWAQETWHSVKGWFGEPSPPPAPMEPRDHAWMAIRRINESGNKFLGQFTVDASGGAQRLRFQGSALALWDLLFGNIDAVERKHAAGETVAAADLAWAAVDAVGVAALGYGAIRGLAKASFATRAATLSRTEQGAAAIASSGRLGRVRLAATRLSVAGSSALRSRIVRWGLVGVAGYLIVTDPAAFNAGLVRLAELLGIPAPLMQVAGWALVFLLPLYLLAVTVGPLTSWVILPGARGLVRLLNPA